FGDAGNAAGSQAGQRLWGGPPVVTDGETDNDNLKAFAAVDNSAPATAIAQEEAKIGDELHGGAGNDTLDGNLRRDYLDGGPGDDTLSGDALAGPNYAPNGISTPTGFVDESAYIGGADTLVGGGGNNHLYGGGGNDRLIGGPNSDWMYGQDGA